MKLYIYDHCPFCTKTLLTRSYLKIACDVELLMYDNEKKPTELIGKKQLPILITDEGEAIAESDEIVATFISLNEAGSRTLQAASDLQKIEQWKAHLSPHLVSLVFPRYLKAKGIKEFSTNSAKAYFKQKKEQTLGLNFEQAEAEKSMHLDAAAAQLDELSSWLTLPSERGDALSFDDVALYPWLRSLTLVRALKFPERIATYLNEVSHLTGVIDFRGIAI